MSQIATRNRVVSIIINLEEIFTSGLSDTEQRHGRCSDAERSVLLSLCEDVWGEVVSLALDTLFRPGEHMLIDHPEMQLPRPDNETLMEMVEIYATESTDLLFNSFAETQFFDLTNGCVRDYIDSTGQPYEPEDYVGEFLSEDLYQQVNVFSIASLYRIYSEVLYAVFQDQPIEVIKAEATALRHHYKLTVEIL
jgi:hypothetical protein